MSESDDNGQKTFPDPAFKPLTGFRPLAQAVRKVARKVRAERQAATPPRGSTLRLIEGSLIMAASDYRPEVAFQHTILCQTCLPYRDPGGDVLEWQRDNGFASLLLSAGKALHQSGQWVQIGLPFGPKPRLILAHLNTQAILTQSPVVDVEQSLTGFVKALKLDHTGYNVKALKQQLTRLAASDFRIGVAREGTPVETHKGQIVKKFDLWMEKDARQRVLWSRSITLNTDYFQSLVAHAVPLDANALACLANNAMALDCYAWLAQRAHRVHPSAPALIGWAALQRQFGQGYTRIRKFREIFTRTLRLVKAVYPAVSFGLDGQGMTISNSPPPIAKRPITVPALPAQAG